MVLAQVTSILHIQRRSATLMLRERWAPPLLTAEQRPICRSGLARRTQLRVNCSWCRIAACTGRCLALDEDLSMQLVLRAPLQEVILQAGLHVALRVSWAVVTSWAAQIGNLCVPVRQ